MNYTDPSFPGGVDAPSDDLVENETGLAIAGSRVGGALDRPRAHPLDGQPNYNRNADRLTHVLQVIRRHLILLLAVGLVIGSGTGYMAWKSQPPVYMSEGLLRIVSNLQHIVQGPADDDDIPNLDTYMQSQVLLIGSRRVLDKALEDPIWKMTKGGVPTDPDKYFTNNLAVKAQPRSEYISVSVKDTDPNAAAAAVTSVITAYAGIYNAMTQTDDRTQDNILLNYQQNLEGQVDALNQQLEEGLAKFGTTNLIDFYDQAQERTTQIKNALDNVKSALAMAPPDNSTSSNTVDPPSTSGSQQAVVGLTDEQIAMSDETMRRDLDVVKHWQDELHRLNREGYGDKFQQVILDKENLADAKKDVMDYGQQYRSFKSATGGAINDPSSGMNPLAGKSASMLKSELANLDQLYKQQYEGMIALGIENHKYQRLNADYTAKSDELDNVNRQIEARRLNAQVGGRLQIISTGEVPVSPERNVRLPAAVVGGCIGLCIPALICALLALPGTRKYSYGTETENYVETKAPLLGIVPELSGDVTEAEVCDAAHSIHQIRVTLRSHAPKKDPLVYLMSSATAREGKTSMTMSLGLSFAAVHTRTLVIDCDLVGCSLTRLLGAQGSPGLKDAMVTGTASDLYRKIAPNLHVLPVGRRTVSADSLSVREMSALLEEARTHFDLVLIDTGPILGSIEAAVLAQEVDGVIFSIVRGQDRSVVERALRRLTTLGAPIAGFIFNRADQGDIRYSSYSYSSHRSSNEKSPFHGTRRAAMESLKDFGPLVQAVVAGMLEEAA